MKSTISRKLLKMDVLTVETCKTVNSAIWHQVGLSLFNYQDDARSNKHKMHKFLSYNKFIVCLYVFRTLYAHHQGVKTILYSIWYHYTCRWPSGAQVERGLVGRRSNQSSLNLRTGWPPTVCDDTRCCIIQFWLPDDEHTVLETCRGI